MKWKIGNVEIKNQVILAPMAGICNSSFRRICKEMGAGLVVAEMVSDKAIEYNNQKTINMLYMENEERQIMTFLDEEGNKVEFEAVARIFGSSY